jgi:hypothetical protein
MRGLGHLSRHRSQVSQISWPGRSRETREDTNGAWVMGYSME